jgi:hypothetical protein
MAKMPVFSEKQEHIPIQVFSFARVLLKQDG